MYKIKFLTEDAEVGQIKTETISVNNASPSLVLYVEKKKKIQSIPSSIIKDFDHAISLFGLKYHLEK